MVIWVPRLKTVCGRPFIVARDQYYDGSVIKQYAAVDTYDTLLNLVSQGGSLYEVCQDEPVRVYFDIDSKRSELVSDADVLHESMSTIKGLLADLGHPVKRKNMSIMTACTPAKISYHIVVPDVAFHDACTRKEFGRMVRKACSAYIDPAPYTRNCLMRCPLSSKLGKSNTLRPVSTTLVVLDDYVLERYLVHSREECATITLAGPSPQAAVSRADCAVDEVVQRLRENGDLTSQFRDFKSSPLPVYYFMTGEKRRCLSGSGETHTRNNFIIYCGPGNTLVYRCFSPKCSGRDRILGSYQAKDAVCVSDMTYNDARCRPFAMLPSGGVQIIQSEMGTGKTYQIRQLLFKHPEATVLIVCFRVELGEYMCRYLEDAHFTFYRTVSGELSQRRLICQVNSLHRIFNASYDILILDEVESIIEQFNGVCALRRRTCWLVLEKLIRDTEHVFALDAQVADRCLEVLKAIRSDTSLVRNMFQSRSNIQLTEMSNKIFFSNMIQAITAGNAIAVTSTSASLLVSLKSSLGRLFPDKSILLIWSQSTDEEKKMYAKDLSHIDVFMYSATLQAGVSIDIVHFFKLFVYITSNGPSPQSLHQMLARIRHFHDNEICLTFDKGSTSNETGEEWSYEQMVSHITAPMDIALDAKISADMGAVISGFAKDWSRVYSFTPFFVCTVHNILQSFNGSRHFRKLFTRQAIAKGYSVVTMTECWDIDNQAQQLLQMTRKEMKMQKEDYYKGIAESGQEAADIEHARRELDTASMELTAAQSRFGDDPPADREELLRDVADKQRAVNEAESRIESIRRASDAHIQKSVLARFYGVDSSDITVDFLKRCEPVASRDAFMRLCLTRPREEVSTEAVQRRISDVMHCEGSHLTSNGVMYAVDTLSRATNGIKLALCHQLVSDLGFEHVFDKRSIVIDFEKADHCIHAHKCHIASAMQLRDAAPIRTQKALLRFCNTVLHKCYKIHIICSKKRKNQPQHHELKHYSFPPYRFVEVSSSCRPTLVSEDLLVKAKLRV